MALFFHIITVIFSTYRTLGHKFRYALYRSTANTTKFINKSLWTPCDSPMYTLWESFLFLVLSLLVIIIAQNQFNWEIYENSLLVCDLIKFMLILIYKL